MPYVGTKQIGRRPVPPGATKVKRYTYDWSALGATFLVGGYTPCNLPTDADEVLDDPDNHPDGIRFYAGSAAPYNYQVTTLYDTKDAQNLTDISPCGQIADSFTPVIVKHDAYVMKPAIVRRKTDGKWFLQVGDDSEPGFGIDIFARVANDTGTGTIAFCQLLTSRRQMTRADGSTSQRTTGGRWFLDKQFPYDSLDTAVKPVTTAQGGVEIFTNDTPREALADDELIVDVKDDFQMYLMYRQGPNTAADHSIWVALGAVEWGWEAVASRAAVTAPWQLAAGAKSYCNEFKAGVEMPVGAGVMQAVHAALLRGGRADHVGV